MLALTALLALPAARAEAWMGVSARAEHSHWQEQDARGRTLVEEQGALLGGGLAVMVRGQGVEWQVELTQVGGDRSYQGVSSTGAPLRTSSEIQRRTASLAAWMPLADRWSAGARLVLRQTDRDIAGVAAVRGYLEHFEDGQASAGVGFDLMRGPHSTLTAQAWLGAGPGGRLSLQLPQTDPTTLQLGTSRLAELGLTWHGDVAGVGEPGWRWWVQLLHRQERSAAGPASAVLRNGVIVGSLAQPETHQTTRLLQAGLLYRFGGW